MIRIGKWLEFKNDFEQRHQVWEILTLGIVCYIRNNFKISSCVGSNMICKVLLRTKMILCTKNMCGVFPMCESFYVMWIVVNHRVLSSTDNKPGISFVCAFYDEVLYFTDCVNALLHTEQLWGFTPVWVLIWFSKFLQHENEVEHQEQLWGFSHVWGLVCN